MSYRRNSREHGVKTAFRSPFLTFRGACPVSGQTGQSRSRERFICLHHSLKQLLWVLAWRRHPPVVCSIQPCGLASEVYRMDCLLAANDRGTYTHLVRSVLNQLATTEWITPEVDIFKRSQQ
jgi:hypothetical protein